MRRFLGFFVGASLAWAQTNDKPIVVRLEAPGAAVVPPSPALPSPALLEQALSALQPKASAGLPGVPEPSAQQVTIAAGSLTRAPKGYKPRTDIALDTNATKALALAEESLHGSNEPVRGKDGTVLFQYGTGLPTIVCAPGHLSTVELEEGEELRAKPQASDEDRWDVIPTVFGTAPTARTVIMLRPLDAGLDANLVVATNRRIYYLRIVSKPSDYMAKVSFRYLDQANSAAWTAYQQQAPALQEKAPTAKAKEPEQTSHCETQNSGYRFKGKSGTYFWPLGACDDGTFSYVTLPDIVRHVGAPVFLVKGPNGLEPVNYDVRDTTFVIHRLFYEGYLVAGTGRHKRQVEVIAPRGNE